MTDGQLYRLITDGVPRTGMPAWAASMDEGQRWAVVTFIRSEVQQ